MSLCIIDCVDPEALSLPTEEQRSASISNLRFQTTKVIDVMRLAMDAFGYVRRTGGVGALALVSSVGLPLTTSVTLAAAGLYHGENLLLVEAVAVKAPRVSHNKTAERRTTETIVRAPYSPPRLAASSVSPASPTQTTGSSFVNESTTVIQSRDAAPRSEEFFIDVVVHHAPGRPVYRVQAADLQSMSIGEVKRVVEPFAKVPAEEQRLFISNRMRSNDEKLAVCLRSGDVGGKGTMQSNAVVRLFKSTLTASISIPNAFVMKKKFSQKQKSKDGKSSKTATTTETTVAEEDGEGEELQVHDLLPLDTIGDVRRALRGGGDGGDRLLGAAASSPMYFGGNPLDDSTTLASLRKSNDGGVIRMAAVIPSTAADSPTNRNVSTTTIINERHKASLKAGSTLRPVLLDTDATRDKPIDKDSEFLVVTRRITTTELDHSHEPVVQKQETSTTEEHHVTTTDNGTVNRTSETTTTKVTDDNSPSHQHQAPPAEDTSVTYTFLSANGTARWVAQRQDHFDRLQAELEIVKSRRTDIEKRKAARGVRVPFRFLSTDTVMKQKQRQWTAEEIDALIAKSTCNTSSSFLNEEEGSLLSSPITLQRTNDPTSPNAIGPQSSRQTSELLTRLKREMALRGALRTDSHSSMGLAHVGQHSVRQRHTSSDGPLVVTLQ